LISGRKLRIQQILFRDERLVVNLRVLTGKNRAVSDTGRRELRGDLLFL
jgi:hypothetical protein